MSPLILNAVLLSFLEGFCAVQPVKFRKGARFEICYQLFQKIDSQ